MKQGVYAGGSGAAQSGFDSLAAGVGGRGDTEAVLTRWS